MIEKQAIFFLIVAITLSSACRPTKADPVAQSTKPEQPLVTSNDKLTQGGNPTVVEEEPSSLIDAEVPTESLLDETPPITPETKLYYNYPTKADYDAGVFPSYVDPKCVTYLQETEKPVYAIEPCYFMGDIIVLAKFIHPITGPDGSKTIDSCIDGKYQPYVKHTRAKVELLYTFKGEITQRHIDIEIFGGDFRKLGNKNEIAILNLHKDHKGNYIVVRNAIFLNLVANSFDTHQYYADDVPYYCNTINLPSKVSTLELILGSRDNQTCDRKKQKSMLADELKSIKNPYGMPGTKCSQNNNDETNSEKEINNISGRKVPCSTCPEGYAIEDLSVDEYMNKVNEIVERRGK